MKALLLAALLVPLSSVLAQETQDVKPLPEELAITRSITLQDADEFQSSAHFSFFKFRDQEQITAATELEYGLTDRWELDADVPYRFVNPSRERAANGIGDVEVGTRYGIVPVGKQPLALDVG